MEEIDGDLLEADFWTESASKHENVSSDLPVI